MAQNNKKNGESSPSDIPQAVVSRLPRYYRCLRNLAVNDVVRVSSKELAEMLDITSSQLRHDLSLFGEFGQQGYGYNVRLLFNQIADILGICDDFSAVLVGSGPLADAVERLPLFVRHGIRFSGRYFTVDGFVEFCENADARSVPDIVVLVLDDPKSAAECAAKVGVRALLNFGEVELEPSRFEGLHVVNYDLSDPLAAVCFKLKRGMA